MTVRELFEAYRAAFEAGDAETVAEFYQIPLTVVRPGRTAVVRTRAHLVRELRKIADTYAWAGLERVRIARFEEVGFDDSLGIVNLTWQLEDAHGGQIARIDSTYTLRRGPAGIGIAAITAHNEESRRAPVISSGRPHAEG